MPGTRLQPNEGDAGDDGDPESGGRVNEAAEADECDGEPHSPPQDRGDGHGADTKRQHARMKVRLERVGAGAGNLVPQGESRNQGYRQPRRRIQTPADRDQAQPDHQQGREVGRKKQHIRRGPGDPGHRRDRFIGQHQAAL